MPSALTGGEGRLQVGDFTTTEMERQQTQANRNGAALARKRALTRASLMGLLAVGVVDSALAQAPVYIRPEAPRKNSVFEVRARYLFTPDVQFAGLGNVPLGEGWVTGSNPFLGTERAIRYDDGYLVQDYISTELTAGEEGSGLVPSPNVDATSNFGYFNESQRDGDTALLFHRYASQGSDEVIEANVGSSTGWELAYTKYISDRRRLGLQMGFSFNGFDSSFRNEIAADLYVMEYRHEMADGALVPDLVEGEPDADGNPTTDPYFGDGVREDVAEGDLLEWAATVPEGEESIIAEGATVQSQAELRSSMYSFRAGPTYSVNLGRRFSMNVGAGVSALYYTGEFSAYEVLQNPGEGNNPSRGLTTTRQTEWQVGPYVDATANYWLTERVSFFSGIQYQGGEGHRQYNEERSADVDFSSQVYAHAGFGIRF